MSESGAHGSIARARAGLAPGPASPPVAPEPAAADDVAESAPSPTEADVRRILAGIPDPELPVVSVVDLGMIHRVAVRPAGITVGILPTFVGCPALDVIRERIASRLAVFGRPVSVQPTFEVPWSSDRISPDGRAALAAAGIAPPLQADEMACPYCRAGDVVIDSAFGPTQCRSLYYCRACRQPFEAMKTV